MQNELNAFALGAREESRLSNTLPFDSIIVFLFYSYIVLIYNFLFKFVFIRLTFSHGSHDALLQFLLYHILILDQLQLVMTIFKFFLILNLFNMFSLVFFNSTVIKYFYMSLLYIT